MNIYKDIETIPGTKPTKAKAPKTIKKAESIAAYEADPENIEKDWRKQSLQTLNGEILCIGLAVNDGEVQILSGEEGDLIEAFYLAMKDVKFPYSYVGHNIKGFDLPFLRHRLFKYGFKLPMPESRYSKMVEDTMDIWAGTDWQNRTSLDNIANFLGLESSKGELDGSKVFDYWQDEREQEIYDYCKKDVELTREIYKRIS